jgi:hypothetical protein
MRLKIHRGTNQIGGNIVEVATERTRNYEEGPGISRRSIGPMGAPWRVRAEPEILILRTWDYKNFA